MKKINEKLDEDVVKELHQYRIQKLGHKSTISQTIRELLKGVD